MTNYTQDGCSKKLWLTLRSSSRGLLNRLTKRWGIIFTCQIISGKGCKEESSENMKVKYICTKDLQGTALS